MIKLKQDQIGCLEVIKRREYRSGTKSVKTVRGVYKSGIKAVRKVYQSTLHVLTYISVLIYTLCTNVQFINYEKIIDNWN